MSEPNPASDPWYERSQPTTQPATPTLLVVDDDPFQHHLVARLLQDRYQLVFANSGIEALNALRKLPPDQILMDLQMPDMDGLEATRRIKGLARFAGVPVIMITGNSAEEVVKDSLLAGAMDFIVKPLARELLLEKIAKGLAHGGSPYR